MQSSGKRTFWQRGEPFVWASGAALTLILLSAAILFSVVLANGLAAFWPDKLALAELKDGTKLLGEIQQQEKLPEDPTQHRLQFKTGNRDLYGLDFRWVNGNDIAIISYPEPATVVERLEYGNFFGFLKAITLNNGDPQPIAGHPEALRTAIESLDPQLEKADEIADSISELNRRLDAINEEMAELRYRHQEESAQYKDLSARKAKLEDEFEGVIARQAEILTRLRQNVALFQDASGTPQTIPLVDIVRFYQPNQMGLLSKTFYFFVKVKELLFAEPRESNTEGGLFPAIFGTVMLIMLMSVFFFPLGVLAGIYLREYARQGHLVRLVRIAVNNLAGIPSIVYGIFGLGFFVYGIGSSIDQLFFPERLPAPTFGTGGILWASLTLGLLTLPVVIVSTEEALGTIPAEIRESSLALGATKFQTLVKLLVPMASPGILTGFILAMARAAGEVAPLMITGVVKIAPALPVDTTFPFVHLDRKFMHLGFHIYDVGFQSPNVEAAKPMVFVTTLLLLLIVLIMSSTAIYLRTRMKKRYTLGSSI